MSANSKFIVFLVTVDKSFIKIRDSNDSKITTLWYPWHRQNSCIIHDICLEIRFEKIIKSVEKYMQHNFLNNKTWLSVSNVLEMSVYMMSTWRLLLS